MSLGDINTEKATSDVLIVGGGLSAMMAAIEASQSGCSILLACKAKVGNSGATLMSAANFAAVLSTAEAGGDNELAHMQDTYNEGWKINDSTLIHTLTKNAPKDLLFLEGLGIQFLKRNGRFELNQPPGHRHARTVFTYHAGMPIKTRGKTVTAPLRHILEQKRIKMLEDVHIFKLLIHDGSIAGALGFDQKNSKIIHIESRSVIIASGGAGTLYARNTNPADLTGDSYMLALEAGCRLRDMEFVQFFPCMHRSLPRLIIYSPTLSCGGVLRDKDGHRFMRNYDPERMELATRDLVSQAIYREIREGRGVDGAIYLDLTLIPSELFTFRFPDLIKAFQKHGIDLKEQWIKVSPAAHFFMGGCLIDACCRTSVPGLFAAGEASGGLHGANRLSGNGLSEALVFGRIAGREAATFILGKRKKPLSSRSIDSKLPLGTKPVSNSRILEIQKRIKTLNWEKVGVVRDNEGLSQAIEELVTLKEYLEKGHPESIKGVKSYLTVRSMLITSLAVAYAAIIRKESRGAHFRDDFPKQDPIMEKPVLVSFERDEIVAKFS